MIHPTLGIRMQEPPAPEPPEWITRRLGEQPLDFLTRNGFELQVYPGLVIGRTYNRAGRCVEDWNGDSMRDLAKKLGWRP